MRKELEAKFDFVFQTQNVSSQNRPLGGKNEFFRISNPTGAQRLNQSVWLRVRRIIRPQTKEQRFPLRLDKSQSSFVLQVQRCLALWLEWQQLHREYRTARLVHDLAHRYLIA